MFDIKNLEVFQPITLNYRIFIINLIIQNNFWKFNDFGNLNYLRIDLTTTLNKFFEAIFIKLTLKLATFFLFLISLFSINKFLVS